jgi:Tol biopolymer transport system component
MGFLLSLAPSGAAPAPSIERVSVGVALGGNANSTAPQISANGRYVAFQSDATNLVPGDTNNKTDIFVRGFTAGQMTRVSVSSGGAQGDGVSSSPSLSADGRFVAFQSDATNLVSGDTNNKTDVFVHDRTTGQTTRVSVSSGGVERQSASGQPCISADGRYVAFASARRILVHDRQTGQTTSTARPPSGTSSAPSISADGRYVAFVLTKITLTPGKPVAQQGAVRLHDRSSGSVTNIAPGGRPHVAADGTLVAFNSLASNLVPGDNNDSADVFVWRQDQQQISRASVSVSGTEGNGSSWNPRFSGDLRYLAFQSSARNLVPGGTNGRTHVFVRNRQSGQLVQVSVSSTGDQGNGNSGSASVSADGRFVVFESAASNLVPGDDNQSTDVFVWMRPDHGEPRQGRLARISVASSEANGSSRNVSVSADGQFVAFESDANNLVAGDTNNKTDVFMRDCNAQRTTLVSIAASGVQGNGSSYYPTISADGRFVAFLSNATNLVNGGTNGEMHVFVWERPAAGQAYGQITMADVTDPEGTQSVGNYPLMGGPAISPDGWHVIFPSFADNLAPGVYSDTFQFFVRDRGDSPSTRLVSVSANGAANSNEMGFCAISTDGRTATFESTATNLLPDTNGPYSDAFVWDAATGSITFASVDNSSPPRQGNGNSGNPSISADGRFVAFESGATNLVHGDTDDGVQDVFVRDRTAPATVRVSRAPSGAAGDGNSWDPSISADGRYVAFDSEATNLISGDTNGHRDVLVWDRDSGQAIRLSLSSTGAEGDGDSGQPSISADGRHVAFTSDASNLVTGDDNGMADCFVVDW